MTAKTAFPVTPEAKLVSLLKEVKKHKKQAAQSVGKLREEIAFACDKHHLDKRVFAQCVKFDAMEPEELKNYWDVLLDYMDKLGLTQRIESAPALELESDSTKKKGDGKVVALHEAAEA